MNSTIFVNMNSTIFSNMNSTLDDISSILVQFQILFFSKRFRFLDYYFCQIPKWLFFFAREYKELQESEFNLSSCSSVRWLESNIK